MNSLLRLFHKSLLILSLLALSLTFGQPDHANAKQKSSTSTSSKMEIKQELLELNNRSLCKESKKLSLKKLGTGTIYGKVTDEKGKALPNLKVNLHGCSASLSVKTDNRGGYEFSNLPKDFYQIEVTDDRYSIDYYAYDITLAKNERKNKDFTFTHNAGNGKGAVEGTVVDQFGDPIRDAFVLIEDETYEHTYEISTDRYGRYTIGGLPEGQYYQNIYATRDDSVRVGKRTPIKIKENDTEKIDTVLPLTFTTTPFKGTIKDSYTGDLIDVRHLTLLNSETGLYFGIANVKGGEIALSGVPSGMYTLTIRKLGDKAGLRMSYREKIEFVAGESAPFEWELPVIPFADGVKVSGLVKDKKTGESVSCAYITVNDKSKGNTTYFNISADEKGSFTFDGMKAGKYIVNTFIPGYKDLNQEFEVKSGKNVSLDLKVVPIDGSDEEPELSSIELNKSELSLPKGKEEQLVLSAVYSNGQKDNVTKQAKWKSKNNKIATISKGKVKAISVGTTTITAEYEDQTITAEVKVSDETLTVTSMKLSPKTISLKPGEKKQLEVKAVLSDKTEKDVTLGSEGTTYSSSNKKLASVSKDGEITISESAKKGSKVTITVKNGGKTAKCTVTVN